MRIKNITLDNFKCFEHLEMDFHPSMNLIVGINGTGKSSVLEALRILLGSLFLSVDKYNGKILCPGIGNDDVRLSRLEQQYPVKVSAVAEMNLFDGTDTSIEVAWERSLETRGGSTRHANAKEMKDVSATMQKAIRDNQDVTIPLVAYYSTDRFKKEKKDIGVEPEGSRLRGYYNALDPLTNIKFFLDLYYTETLASLQNGKPSELLQCVNKAVMVCLDCESLIFDIKKQELVYTDKNTHERIPFHLLSDGVRCTLSMVMEIAFRCYILNSYLGSEAAIMTDGVVLIDEVDLHLHPSWQMHVVNDLCKAFPQIQFVLTTHAPLIISSLKEGNIYSIVDKQTFDFGLQSGRDANYILNEMGVQEMGEDEKKLLQDYLLMIENGQGLSNSAREQRVKLEKLLGVDNAELKKADIMLSFFS